MRSNSAGISSVAKFENVSETAHRTDDRQVRATDVLHAQWLSGVRVLAVADSAMNREVAQGILQSQGAIAAPMNQGT